MEKFRHGDFNENRDNDTVFEEIDALIEYLKTLPRHGMHIMNFERVREIKAAYDAIKQEIRKTGCGAKVTCGRCDFDSTFGYVEIEGKTIEIRNMKCLSAAIKISDNAEAYTLVNGNVRMTFTFWDMLLPL